MIGQLFTMLFFTIDYAVLRYAGFADVSPIHIPGYLTNKALAMTAAISLLLAALALVRSQREAARFWVKASVNLVFIHVLLSAVLLSKGYFPKWFTGEMMNLRGEGMLLLGVLAAYCFWRVQSARLPQRARLTVLATACALVAGHLFVMGSDGWLQFTKWNGGLPPITLLSFLVLLPAISLFLSQGRGRIARPHKAAGTCAGKSEPSILAERMCVGDE